MEEVSVDIMCRLVGIGLDATTAVSVAGDMQAWDSFP
jgi:hypothetical protein